MATFGSYLVIQTLFYFEVLSAKVPCPPSHLVIYCRYTLNIGTAVGMGSNQTLEPGAVERGRHSRGARGRQSITSVHTLHTPYLCTNPMEIQPFYHHVVLVLSRGKRYTYIYYVYVCVPLLCICMYKRYICKRALSCVDIYTTVFLFL